MICPKCLEERSKEDFQNKVICFKCVFKIKTCLPFVKPKICLMCSEIVPTRRNKYCSFKCAEKADFEYWTRRIRSSPI